MPYDRRDWDEREIQVLRQEIAQRLRAVCERLPVQEFDQLVEQMARLQHKYERHRSDELFRGDREERVQNG
jgi:hypothetical protein